MPPPRANPRPPWPPSMQCEWCEWCACSWFGKSTASSRQVANDLNGATSLESNRVTAMNPCVAFEILRDGAVADVLDVQVGQRRRIELEAGVVGREYEAPGRAQQLQRAANHPGVIALDVQHTVHPLGIGEGRRIHEDQIEARTPGFLFLKPLQTVRAIQLVLGTAKAVEQEILVCPVQIGIRKVDADAAARTARRRVDRGAAGIAK